MRVLLIAAALSWFAPNALAADLAVGQTIFTLGQSEMDARKLIEGNFKVISLATPNDLVLADPNSSKVLGTISFKKGHVSYIGRSWGNFREQDSSLDSANALTSALESATKQSGAVARIRTETTRQPNAEYRVTYFTFPGRKISYIVSKSDIGGEQVAIGESIFP